MTHVYKKYFFPTNPVLFLRKSSSLSFLWVVIFQNMQIGGVLLLRYGEYSDGKFFRIFYFLWIWGRITNVHLRNSIMKANNPRDFFVAALMMKLEEKGETEQLLKIACKVGHSLRTSVSRVAYTMFNIRAKNYISEKMTKYT